MTAPQGTQAGPAHPSRRARRARRARRRIAAAVVALAAVAATALAVVLLAPDLMTRPGPTPPPVVLPLPTPSLEPADRTTDTPFQRALPDVVLAFAVAEQATDEGLLDSGAVEAYRLAYTDGEQEVLLRAAQWPLIEDAQLAMAELLAGAGGSGEPVLDREGPVLVGGTEVGWVVIGTIGAQADAVWTNGATLFALTGPAAVVPSFYDAFPM